MSSCSTSPPGPLVSIITVAFNAVRALEKTIEQVLALRYPAIEYIIIDGASTDGTLALLNQYRHQLGTILIEPDDGIYHAMNKGIQAAAGEYLWFINAGDTPGDPDVLTPLLSAPSLPDFIYGDTRLIRPDSTLASIARAPQNLGVQHMTKGMAVSHQSFLARRVLTQPYDVSYRYIADQKWIVDILRRSQNGLRLQAPVSNYLLGGLSYTKYGGCLVEKIRYSAAELPPTEAALITIRDLMNAARFYAGAAARKLLQKP